MRSRTNETGLGEAAVAPALSYRPDIDGLRAVAVLLVLAFHFALVPGAKAGFLGVDVFFTISGFLITRIILGQMAAGTFHLGDFYVARIRRLAPSLFAVLLGTAIAGGFLLFPTDFQELCRQLLYAQLYLANVYFANNVGYFELQAPEVPLLHTWSLAVEEQFYLLYPPLLLLVFHRRRQHLWLIVALVFVISLAASLGISASKPRGAFYLLGTRAWELLLGALVAYAATRWLRPAWANMALGVLGVVLIAAAIALYHPAMPLPGAFALLPTLAGACLLLAGDTPRAPTTRLLSHAVPVYIGRISYPLYLVHWPVNVFAAQALAGYSTDYRLRLAMLAVSFVLAAVLYHWIETPIRRHAVLPRTRSLLTTYAAGVAVTAGLFVAAYVTAGLPQRLPAAAATLAASVNDKPSELKECRFGGRGALELASLCRIGAAAGEPTWLLLGDLHAWAAQPAFDRWLAAKGQAGVFVYRHNCLPVEGFHMAGDRGVCAAMTTAALNLLTATPQIRDIAMVSTWAQVTGGSLALEPNRPLSLDVAKAEFSTRFEAMARKLKAQGVRLHVWEPVPGALGHVPREMARAAWRGTPLPAWIAISRESYERDYAFLFAVMDRHPDLVDQRFSPSRALCGTGTCRFEDKGRPLYSDKAHITRSTIDVWLGVLESGQHGSRPQRAR